MIENTFLCRHCQNIFKLSLSEDSPTEKDNGCPRCGYLKVEEIPSWMPMGSDLAEGIPMWEYECQLCKHTFKLPVPESPSQEKEIRCPECTGDHIHRLTSVGGEPLYCG